MPSAIRLFPLPSVEVREVSSRRFELGTEARSVPLVDPPTGVLTALRRLLEEGEAEDELVALVMAQDGYGAVPELYRALFALADLQLLGHAVWSERGPVATARPLSTAYPLTWTRADPTLSYVLSRFACVRRLGPHLVVESPLSHARIELGDGRTAGLLARLATPTRAAELGEDRGDLEADTSRLVLDLLSHAGMLTATGEGGEAAEDLDPALETWEFHDLFFHSRSRLGRHDHPYGGTFPFRGRMEPLPAVKRVAAAEGIPLHRPDLDALRKKDRPLTRVLEGRRSLRQHGEPPISARELGEFLFRTLAVRGMVDGEDYETTRRVYPGGGAAYEIEAYPVVRCCDGLAPGLYHYEPLEHALSRLAAPDSDLEALLETAAHTASSARPQVLLVLTARFRRVTWKYRSMAYATILKDVGALYQTMYLVATAMGLAPCALGGGNADRFARASGISYLEEGAVGEFMLGRAV